MKDWAIIAGSIHRILHTWLTAPEVKMEIKPIRMTLNAGLDALDDAPISLDSHFRSVAEAVQVAYRDRFAGAAERAMANDVSGLIVIIGDFLALMRHLDREYGSDCSLPIGDAPEAVDEALRALAELESWLIRLNLNDYLPQLQTIEIGVGYWAMRHALSILKIEPIVNALAAQANAGNSKQETAAIYAMMQGFICHFAPAFEPDLERSNPQRPWRLLNLNFAITAIRTGDGALMRFAFDTLNSHLPEERRGFYEEAHVLASQPGFPLATRSLIEAEIARWTRVH